MPSLGNAKLCGIRPVDHTYQQKVWKINVAFSSSDPIIHDGTQHTWLLRESCGSYKKKGRMPSGMSVKNSNRKW